MKKWFVSIVIFAMLSSVFPSLTIAESDDSSASELPLSHAESVPELLFFSTYKDISIVETAIAKGAVTQEIAEYLHNPANPLDVKAAVINAIAWKKAESTNGNADLYTNFVFKKQAKDIPSKDLHAEELFVIGYLLLTDQADKRDVALSLLKQAKTKKPNSFTINLVAETAERNTGKETCGIWTGGKTALRGNGDHDRLREQAILRIVFDMFMSRGNCLPDDIAIEIDGYAKIFRQDPVFQNETIMVPLEDVLGAMGAKIHIDGNTVTATRGEDKISLSIGERTGQLNGETLTLKEPVNWINGTLMIPDQLLVQFCKAEIEWDPSSQALLIRSREAIEKENAEMPEEWQSINLMNAIYEGDAEKVKELIEHGADPNQPGNLALLRINPLSQPEMIKLLIDYGADVNAENPEGITFWSHLLDSGAETDEEKRTVVQLAEYSLNHGADPNLHLEGMDPPIVEALRYKYKPIAELLLAKGANLESKGRNGDTALHLAAMRGYTELAQKFLSAKVDPNMRNDRGETALHIAVQHKSDIAKLLLKSGAKPDLKDDQGHTPLMLASYAGENENVRLLIQHKAIVNAQNDEGNSALMLAVKGLRPDVVKTLLGKGAKVNMTNKEGKTALMFAAENGALTSVAVYLAAKADLWTMDAKTFEIQKQAAYRNNINIVAELYRAGANPNLTDNQKRTALAIAKATKNEPLIKAIKSAPVKKAASPK